MVSNNLTTDERDKVRLKKRCDARFTTHKSYRPIHPKIVIALPVGLSYITIPFSIL